MKLCAVAVLAVFLGASASLLGTCGPFTDVAADAFCPFVLEIFMLGITSGTTATTYDPTSNVTRLQMSAFLSRTVDRTLQRGSRRAALNRFWTTSAGGITPTNFPGPVLPAMAQSDGTDVWVTDNEGGRVFRVRGSDGKLLDTWTGASSAYGILAVDGSVYVGGEMNPGRLYYIDPTAPGGIVSLLSTSLGDRPLQLAYDGTRIWSANLGGSVSLETPGTGHVDNINPGFNSLYGILFDGSNMWVTDSSSPGKLSKLDSNGAILQSVTVGSQPRYPVFDGSNIWVPNYFDNTVSVVRASNGAVLATLTGNGLDGPAAAAFDGQRTLVTNFVGNSVSLWKAADLTSLGSTLAGSEPNGACSDGLDFWIVLYGGGAVARF
jgi:hypothetical protein